MCLLKTDEAVHIRGSSGPDEDAELQVVQLRGEQPNSARGTRQVSVNIRATRCTGYRDWFNQAPRYFTCDLHTLDSASTQR